jgi:putative membrane protein
MLILIAYWFLSALCLMIVAHVVPGFEIKGFGTALIAAIVIGLINATIGLVLKIVTLPFTIITFGLFLFVINALMLRFSALFVSGFVVKGFLPAFLGAVALAILNTALRHLVFKY